MAIRGSRSVESACASRGESATGTSIRYATGASKSIDRHLARLAIFAEGSDAVDGSTKTFVLEFHVMAGSRRV